MELRICVLVLNCLMACRGLKFKLDLDKSGQGTAKSVCGVLICEEKTNVSVSSISSTSQTTADVDLNTIDSMSVFKKNSAVSDTSNGQTEFLLGSLTSQAPSLTWVANGQKLEGSLQPGRASLRIELVKQADCESEFSCQVRGKDSHGRQVINTASLVQPCVSNKTTGQHKLYPQPLMCARKSLNHIYPKYITMTQLSLNRDILCDTQTDGGGWTVIMRRTKGDVDFNRDWESYKHGFGKPQADEDFWLGNEAVHFLTSSRPYELRVELTADNYELVQRYKTFKVESETLKYTLRLGRGKGPLSLYGMSGLAYSDNGAFSTKDRDNDESSKKHCAASYRCGWWYKNCCMSKLTAPWQKGHVDQAWHDGEKFIYPTRAEMKIRRL